VRGPEMLSKLQGSHLVEHMDLSNLTARLQSGARDSASYVLVSLPDWASRFFDILTCIILTFYFMLEASSPTTGSFSLFAAPTRRA